MQRRTPDVGFTLVELIVVVAIASVLLGIALPSFVGAMGRVRLEGAVNELSVDLQYTRSLTIRRRLQHQLVTASDGGSYTVVQGSNVLKTVTLPRGVRYTSDVSVAFDPLRGTAADRTIDASSTQTTGQLRVTTSAMGRVQLCALAGFSGYQAC